MSYELDNSDVWIYSHYLCTVQTQNACSYPLLEAANWYGPLVHTFLRQAVQRGENYEVHQQPVINEKIRINVT